MVKKFENYSVWQSHVYFFNKEKSVKKNYGQAEYDLFHVCLQYSIILMTVEIYLKHNIYKGYMTLPYYSVKLNKLHLRQSVSRIKWPKDIKLCISDILGTPGSSTSSNF